MRSSCINDPSFIEAVTAACKHWPHGSHVVMTRLERMGRKDNVDENVIAGNEGNFVMVPNS